MSRLPELGRRGEGWVVAQSVLGLGVVIAGLLGPPWPDGASRALTIAGLGVGVAGLLLFVLGVVSLGPSLTPFPQPGADATLREHGVYRRARHPIYGGVLLMALGWSLARSPVALVATVLLWVLLELKSRHEETMLLERYPAYAAYRARVRRRLIPGLH
jgi:protein-S-isoprenylcysteine O-methyltransferase Ste14